MNAALLASLEQAAEIAGDIAPAIYARYFERCPDSMAIMVHTDEHMRGRMIEEVYRLLMAEDVSQERDYLVFETSNHRAYGAQPHMYENLLLATQDVVEKALGENFDDAMKAAWEKRLEDLLSMLRPFAAAV